LRAPPPSLFLSSTLASRARPRLNLLARHLALKPTLELNTPFSVDRRASVVDDDLDPLSIPELDRGPVRAATTAATQTIENKEEPAMAFQEAHPALLIPGPIELEDDVLRAMGHFRWGRGNRAGAVAD
jgi:alanine-glyoxylate transaminase / serine-glyoxylate transaminase / serine-pyruvate transaminase